MDSNFETSRSPESSDSSCSFIASYLVDQYGLADPVEVRELESEANQELPRYIEGSAVSLQNIHGSRLLRPQP